MGHLARAGIHDDGHEDTRKGLEDTGNHVVFRQGARAQGEDGGIGADQNRYPGGVFPEGQHRESPIFKEEVPEELQQQRCRNHVDEGIGE